jgi:hypothetical protein
MKQEFCSWHPHKRVDISVRNRNADWHLRASGNPLLVSLKLDAYLVVEDPQIAILALRDCVRLNPLHILRHNTDIGFVAAIVAEAIEANAVGKMTEKNDIVLECDVRTPSSAAAGATATATRSHTATATATRSHTATTARSYAATATKTGMAA